MKKKIICKKKPKKLVYVIHEHHATHLHWDLRLEIDGVLKSWALPKEPLLKIGIKRLAVEVEDHPKEYATFEGEIPKGYYGAGTVKIWDNGFYEILEKNEKSIVLNIRGKKLNGTYALIKLKEKNWLFFKKNG